MEPDAVEIRVVGCLVEKQRTTPDAYPLSLLPEALGVDDRNWRCWRS